jgi:hypothetical protein
MRLTSMLQRKILVPVIAHVRATGLHTELPYKGASKNQEFGLVCCEPNEALTCTEPRYIWFQLESKTKRRNL